MSPPSNQLLSSADRRTLLDIARRSITQKIAHGCDWRPDAHTGILNELRGVFVTLERRGRLRGCIGQPQASDPLAIAVAHCAVASAMKDARFKPVVVNELSDLHIEISVLSVLERIDPANIEVGRHGLHITNGAFRGLLLPQVPVEHNWDAPRLLEETCIKSGLPADAWKSQETIVQAFTAEVFSDAEIADATESSRTPSLSLFT
jgi:AmmeMemoRadiSam system protein A